MLPQQWDRVRRLFHEAKDFPPGEWPAFLQAACDDPELRAEVEDLLASDEKSTGFLEQPAMAHLPGALEQAFQASPGADAGPSRNPLAPGMVLKGRYRLERHLGRGGFGTVFLAADEQLHSRLVVVKTLLEENSRDPWFQKRFAEEIRTLAAIDHPCVVAILDSGQLESGVLFLVMQYAEGETLRSLIRAGGMPFGRVAGLVHQIAEGLTAAHERGVVHQDLKPENIMVQPLAGGGERVRLIDFGIARLKSDNAETTAEQLSRIAGSLPYMSPEQLRGYAAIESDIYSLGVVAFEMLTGRKPFDANGETIPPRSLRTDLRERAEQALLQSLSFRPADRPSSALEFARQLCDGLAATAAPFQEPPSPGPVLAGEPLAYDVFVSHAYRDFDLAARLAAALESRGLRCFIAGRDLQPDDLFPAAIHDAVKSSYCCVLVVSQAANVSVQVSREAQLALITRTPLVALRVDQVEPSGDLGLYLGPSHCIDASGDLADGDLERIERAIRVYVPRISRPARAAVPFPALQDSGGGGIPASPRLGQRRVKVIAFFACGTLFTCLLSALANTAYVTVYLQAPESQAQVPVRFGYLYELNAAVAYLLIVPWFIYFAMGFVMETRVALANLAGRDQIVVNRLRAPSGRFAAIAAGLRRRLGHPPPEPAPRAFATPLRLVAEAHHRWMSRPLWLFAVVLSLMIVVGTEFLPPKSDYRHVMFGYLQAPAVAEYPERCRNCTLHDLEAVLERRIEPQGILSAQQLARYRIVEPFYRRAGTAVERAAFAAFVASVLGLEVAFALFVFWAVFNAFFFLQLIYRAISPGASSMIGLHLRYTDPARVFGLEPIHRALRHLVAVVCVSVILPVFAWWTNVMKGSRRALGQDLTSLGGWGQFLISNGSLIMAVAMLVYLFSIGAKGRDSAAEESNRRAIEMPRNSAANDESQTLIADQSVWRKMRYTIPYIAAPFVCVFAVLLLDRLELANAVGNIWEQFLRSILGMR